MVCLSNVFKNTHPLVIMQKFENFARCLVDSKWMLEQEDIAESANTHLITSILRRNPFVIVYGFLIK